MDAEIGRCGFRCFVASHSRCAFPDAGHKCGIASAHAVVRMKQFVSWTLLLQQRMLRYSSILGSLHQLCRQ